MKPKQTAKEWLSSQPTYVMLGKVMKSEFDAMRAISMAREEEREKVKQEEYEDWKNWEKGFYEAAKQEGRQEAAKEIFMELDIARRKGMGFYMRSSEYTLIKSKWVKKE